MYSSSRIPEDREMRDSISVGSSVETSTTGPLGIAEKIVRGENGILGRATRGMRGDSAEWKASRQYGRNKRWYRASEALSSLCVLGDIPLIPLKIVTFLSTS